MKNKTRYNSGFTLIELMVVIAIIALLSSVVLAALSSARERARTVRAQAELKEITNAIIIAQGEQSKPLVKLAPSSNCGQCSCTDLTVPACLAQWKTALSQIEAATNGLVTGLSKFEKDPWGNPYFIDANQGESGAGSCNTIDLIGSYNHSIPNQNSIPLSQTCP